jgi:hypothetical protein
MPLLIDQLAGQGSGRGKLLSVDATASWMDVSFKSAQITKLP